MEELKEKEKIKIKPVEMRAGQDFMRWTYKSATALFVTGKGYATLSDISVEVKGKGHAAILLNTAKSYYGEQGRELKAKSGLPARMRKILEVLEIPEYREGSARGLLRT